MIQNVSIAYTFANLLLAIIIFFLRRTNQINRFYLFCVFVLDVMGVAAHFLALVPGEGMQFVIRALLIFCFSLLPFFFLHFLAIFFRRTDIIKSGISLSALYFAGLFSYAMVLLGFIPEPMTITNEVTSNGYLFYVTWHSVLFCIGIAILHEMKAGFYGKVEKSNLLFTTFAMLMLLLPGPFINAMYFRLFHLSVDLYFVGCTIAIILSVYFIFRYKIIVNTVYDAMKAALGVMNDIFILTDLEFNIQMVRGGYKALLRYEEPDLLGKNFGELLAEPYLLDAYRDYAVKGKMTQSYFDAEVHCADGADLAMNFSFTPVYGNQEIVGFVSIGRDITELRLSERYLRIFNHALESTPEFIAISDVNDKITYTNKALQQHYGYTTDELIGRPVSIFRSPQHQSTGHWRSNDLNKSGAWSGELNHVTKSGREFPVHLIASPIFNEEGEMLGSVSSAEDITEKIAAARAIQVSEARYRSLFEHVPVGIYQMSTSGEITTANPTLARMLGHQNIDHGALAAMRETLRSDEALKTAWNVMVDGGEDIQNLESTVQEGDRTISLLHNVRTFRGSDGVILYFEGTVNDITERKKLENELLHAQRMESIGTLAGGIAHDFNNILQIVQIFASKIRRDPSTGEHQIKNVQSILDCVTRGAALIRQLMTFARKSDMSMALLDPHTIIHDLRNMLIHTFPPNIEIRMNLREQPLQVMADKTQLHQVLLNLCVNARDAMPEGGILSVETDLVHGSDVTNAPSALEAGKQYLRVTVRDTGTGMTEQVRQRIFEPFFTTKDVNRGTGLGLAVVYGIVKNHSGHIIVESEPGHGTVFTLLLPALGEADEAAKAETTVSADRLKGTETILLVEDEVEVRDSLKGIFESNGYRVLTAEDGLAAVELYTTRFTEIAAALINLGLPKLSGMEAFLRMRKINPEIIGILCSGYIDPTLRSAAASCGVKGFIEKPFVADEILLQIRELLAAAEPVPGPQVS